MHFVHLKTSGFLRVLRTRDRIVRSNTWFIHSLLCLTGGSRSKISEVTVFFIRRRRRVTRHHNLRGWVKNGAIGIRTLSSRDFSLGCGFGTAGCGPCLSTGWLRLSTTRDAVGLIPIRRLRRIVDECSQVFDVVLQQLGLAVELLGRT